MELTLLHWLILVPVVTIAGLLLCRDPRQPRYVALAGMTVQLGLAIALLVSYLKGGGTTAGDEMFLFTSWKWFDAIPIRLDMGVDGVSVSLILLTAIVIVAGVLISWRVETKAKEFFILLIALGTGVFGFFLTLDLFSMFLFYEIAVIPMYLLIGIWGSGPREYAAMKLTLMLMAGSAFIMVGLFGVYFYSNNGAGEHTFNILEISRNGLPLEMQRFFFPFTFVGFGILGALFPFHTWSPDGHASAPTAVSMLHAGVLMKLGGYGCYRVAMFLMPQAAQEMSTVFIVLTGISVIYGALGAIKQTDLKYINAYSSVSHCGLVLFAILMMNETALSGAMLQMLSHGLMTALFFALIGMIYERTHTRDINRMGGLLKVIPFISACYVIGGLASLGLPGMSGFVAELTIFVGAFSHPDTFHRFWTILSVSAIVVTAVYILRVIGIMLMGQVKPEEHLPPATWYERAGAVTLILPIVLIGMMPGWIMDMIRMSVQTVARFWAS